MKETFKKLEKGYKDASEECRKFREAIEALQEVCEHDYKDDGHDSHKDYYKCAICGHETDC